MSGTIHFIGRYDHLLDDKNRLMIPQAYRDAVEQANEFPKFTVTLGFDYCLSMYPQSAWEQMRSLIEAKKNAELANPKSRKFVRTFYSYAASVVPDRAGRILIPENLKRAAGLDKRVAMIGVGDHVELWDQERWEKYSAGEEGEYEQAASETFGAASPS